MLESLHERICKIPSAVVAHRPRVSSSHVSTWGQRWRELWPGSQIPLILVGTGVSEGNWFKNICIHIFIHIFIHKFTNIFVKVAWLLLKVDWMPISTAIASCSTCVKVIYRQTRRSTSSHWVETSMGSGSRFDSVGWTLQPLCWCRAYGKGLLFWDPCHLPWFAMICPDLRSQVNNLNEKIKVPELKNCLLELFSSYGEACQRAAWPGWNWKIPEKRSAKAQKGPSSETVLGGGVSKHWFHIIAIS